MQCNIFVQKGFNRHLLISLLTMDHSATTSDTAKPSAQWLRHQHNPLRSSQPTPHLQTPVMHSNSLLGSRSHTFTFSTPRTRSRNDSTNPGRTRGGVLSSEVNNAKRGGPFSAGTPRQDPYFQDEVTQVFERERSRYVPHVHSLPLCCVYLQSCIPHPILS